jgi:7-cyano-7-deazaguanine synthase in queuosine biosynthesis
LAAQYVVTHGLPGGAVLQTQGDGPVWQLDWTSPRRNATCELAGLRSAGAVGCGDILADLLDLSCALYLADIATPRGRAEEWVRTISLDIPVRDPHFWRSSQDTLLHLLYTLTRDNWRLRFHERALEERPAPTAHAPDVDCVCLLSGGLDSMAGAAMLLHTGRRPLLVSHYSGNPTVGSAQRQTVAALQRLAPGRLQTMTARVAPHLSGRQALPFPPPEMRENSRRVRSLLFLSLGIIAAHAAEVCELYLCENGILTAALPLTPARSGSLSTRSTHPLALQLLGEILELADCDCSILNPFVHQTKGEVVRTFLKPLFAPTDILQTVSCWAAGRQHLQCGGCIPCLLRRIALLASGLPDETYMMDLLGSPEDYRGTDAYGNLVDLLTQAAELLTCTDFELLVEHPQLLDLEAAGVSVTDTIRALRRHAAETQHVLMAHFPASAALLGRMSAG